MDPTAVDKQPDTGVSHWGRRPPRADYCWPPSPVCHSSTSSSFLHLGRRRVTLGCLDLPSPALSSRTIGCISAALHSAAVKAIESILDNLIDQCTLQYVMQNSMYRSSRVTMVPRGKGVSSRPQNIPHSRSEAWDEGNSGSRELHPAGVGRNSISP